MRERVSRTATWVCHADNWSIALVGMGYLAVMLSAAVVAQIQTPVRPALGLAIGEYAGAITLALLVVAAGWYTLRRRAAALLCWCAPPVAVADVIKEEAWASWGEAWVRRAVGDDGIVTFLALALDWYSDTPSLLAAVAAVGAGAH